MSNYSTSNAHKSLEPPLPYPGATPDAERAQKPALPEPPYKPYAKKSAPRGSPYKPYAEKSGALEPPYKPYARSQHWPNLPMNPTKACSRRARVGRGDCSKLNTSEETGRVIEGHRIYR
jgi:hypothetical protein